MTILPQIPTLSACSPPQSLCPNNGLSAVPQTSYTDCCLGPFNVCSNCQDCPSPRCALGLLLHPFLIVVSIRCFQFVSSYFHLNAFQSGVHLHLSTEIALVKIMNNFHLVQSNGLICSPCLTRPISSIWHTDESPPYFVLFTWLPRHHILLVSSDLTDCSFPVSFNGSPSPPRHLKMGVPLGSVPVLLLISIYTSLVISSSAKAIEPFLC